jgi:hypothetical protein
VDAYGRPHVFNSLAMTSRTLAKADMADLEVKREGRKIEAEVESIMKVRGGASLIDEED